MKLTVNRLPDWMNVASWKEWNSVSDLQENWKINSEEVHQAHMAGEGLAELQHKYKCPVTVLNMIWLNQKFGQGTLLS